jgi:hypothetical protein
LTTGGEGPSGPKSKKIRRVFDNLVLRKVTMERNKNVVVWDS